MDKILQNVVFCPLGYTYFRRDVFGVPTHHHPTVEMETYIGEVYDKKVDHASRSRYGNCKGNGI